MAFSDVRCGSGNNVFNRGLPYLPKPCIPISRPAFCKIPNRGSRAVGGSRISMATTEMEPRRKRSKGGVFRRETLDRWMRESVVDIVKNLQESALFLNVYSSKDGESARLETESAAKKEDWLTVKRRWESGEAQMPEGIIFVERIDDYDEEEQNNDGVTRSWGIVVQGRGAECGGPACYLLKTSRVSGGPGLGCWCIHFCLVKVKNFRETAKSQLKNCWLLQSNLL